MQTPAESRVRISAEAFFASGLFCAESVVMAVAQAEGVDSALLPRAASAFCSGMGRTCGPCGALTGAVMAVGLALGRSNASQSIQPAYNATQRLVREFEERFGSRDCQALLDGCDLDTPAGQAMFKARGLHQRCLRYTGAAAEIAARVIAENRS